MANQDHPFSGGGAFGNHSFDELWAQTEAKIQNWLKDSQLFETLKDSNPEKRATHLLGGITLAGLMTGIMMAKKSGVIGATHPLVFFAKRSLGVFGLGIAVGAVLAPIVQSGFFDAKDPFGSTTGPKPGSVSPLKSI